MKILRKAVCMLIALTVLILPVGAESTDIATEYYSEDIFTPLPVIAPLDETSFTVPAKSAILMEASTGEVIFEQNCHEPLAPASVTKIMTLLLVMEAIDEGKLTLETSITPSEFACSMGGSQIWLKPDESMTVDELLRATVIASANDAAVALGEAVAGSNDAFVRMMNLKAQELGMADTNFINPTGLDADGHATSAHDIAVMSRELLKHDLIKTYSTVWMDSLRNGQSQLVNTNKLVRFYAGTTGLKTGTTSKAGHCLSASAEREGMELIAVVMGSDNSNDRFSAAKQLLDFGFANYTVLHAEIDPATLPLLQVSGGVDSTLSLEPAHTADYLVMKTTDQLSYECSLPEKIEAPIAKGYEVGTAKVMLGETCLGEIPIVAAEGAQKMTFWAAFKLLWNALLVA